ncbi:MAG: serine protease [Deltaproteobacteria bacterium]|jgi:V8-like Glu-specific endopeptidase|nr:serine protease [Deltaproteobacteria bacterium]
MKVFSATWGLGKALITLAACLMLIAILPAPCQGQGPAAQPYDHLRKVAEDMERSTFFILVESDKELSSGSGFLVADGYIVTNGHVVEDIDKGGTIYVLNKYLKPVQAVIVNNQYDQGSAFPGSRDLALLRFEQPKGANLRPVTFNLDISRLDWVSAWGYPGMMNDLDANYKKIVNHRLDELIPLPVSSTTGTINAMVHGTVGDMIVHSAQISSGNSGGPLVNWKGEVVGINTWAYNVKAKEARTNLAQPATEIVAFLYSNRVNAGLAEGQILPPHKTEPAMAAQRRLPPANRRGTDRGRSGASPKRPAIDSPAVVILGSITFSVPASWHMEYQDENSASLVSDDGEAGMMIVTESNGPYSLEEIANIYSDAVKGSEATPTKGLFTFKFEENGEDSFGVVQEIPKNKHLMYCVFGDYDNTGVGEIIESLKLK